MSREKKPPKVKESRVGKAPQIAVSSEEAEVMLGLGKGYLKEYRANGSRTDGRPAPPPHIKLDPSPNGRVIYLVEDLAAWARSLPKVITP